MAQELGKALIFDDLRHVRAHSDDPVAWAVAMNALALPTGRVAGMLWGDLAVASPIAFGRARNLSVDAGGAHVDHTADGILINLNADVTPTTPTTNGFVIHWSGGTYFNSAATRVASIGMAVRGVLGLTLDGAPRFNGFHKGIELAGQGNHHIIQPWLTLCDYGICISDYFGTVSGAVLIATVIESPYLTLNSSLAGIYAIGRFSNLTIHGGSSNGAPTIASMYFQSGNSFNPFNLKIDAHHFEQGTADTRYLWIAATGGRKTVNVSVVDSSFADATVGGADAVRGMMRFESVEGLRIANNNFGATSQGGACLAYFDENCKDITWGKDNFHNLSNVLAWWPSTAFVANQVAAPSTYGELVFICTTAGTSGASEPTWPTTVGDTVEDGTAEWTAICAPIIYKCARDEITIEPAHLSLDDQIFSGYSATTRSGAEAGETVNVRRALGTSAPDLMPPKGLVIHVKVRDSSSSTAADCFVGFAKDETEWSTASNQRKIQIGDRTNNQEHTQTFEVPCDANGNIYMRFKASGTMTVTILGVAVLQ